MSSKWKRQGKQKFVMLHRYVLQSAAWRHLSPNARAAYLELKWSYSGSNNGALALSVREIALALHIGKSTAAAAFRELETHGFIAVTTKGAFSVKFKRATEWRLTEYQCDQTGELPTKEFMRWQAAEKNTVPSQVLMVPSQVHHDPKQERKYG